MQTTYHQQPDHILSFKRAAHHATRRCYEKVKR